MFLSIIRAIKFSFQDIGRNIWLSLVTIIILILALFSVNMLLAVKVISDATVVAIKDRIDVSLYLKNTSPEEDILMLKSKLSDLPEVKDVVYISKAEALESFQNDHKGNPEILASLKALGKNPLTPTLVIKPKNLDNLDTLITNLNKFEDDVIESRNFANYKLILSKIDAITDKVSDAGIFISAIFVFITLLVVYNAIRVAIYTHRKEIAIMKLVGASNMFIILPFIISSVIYTLIGLAFIILIFYPFLTLLQPYLETFFIGYNINIITYFNSNFFQIFGIQLIAASIINVAASLIAVRKYADI